MSKYWEELGKYFKEQRERNGYSLQDVADHFEIGKTSLFNYESGQRKIPMELIKKLCVYYGVRLEDTFELMIKFL